MILYMTYNLNESIRYHVIDIQSIREYIPPPPLQSKSIESGVDRYIDPAVPGRRSFGKYEG